MANVLLHFGLKVDYKFLVRFKNGFKNKKLRYFFFIFLSGIYYY